VRGLIKKEKDLWRGIRANGLKKKLNRTEMEGKFGEEQSLRELVVSGLWKKFRAIRGEIC